MRNLLLITRKEGNNSLSAYLKGLGYKISSVVKSAEQAIETAQKFSPDIIVMDFEESKQIDGKSIYQKIRQHQIEIPIIYMSVPSA